MAEQEVIKHTENAVKIWGSKTHSFWQKLKEFFVEIFIIVFAISLSIWFHNRSDHQTEQQQVKTFLTGLKSDITEDIANTKEIISEYKYYDTVYTFLSKLQSNKTPDKDSLHLFVQAINSNIFLRPHKSRFEGFLSSGKIMNIESDSLVSGILLYYQEAIPQIVSSEGGWMYYQSKLQEYIYDNLNSAESDSEYLKILATPKGNYLCKHLIPWQQIYDRYNAFIAQGQSIINQINQQYPDK